MVHLENEIPLFDGNDIIEWNENWVQSELEQLTSEFADEPEKKRSSPRPRIE